MKATTESVFDELIGEDLSGVTFVRDYLQLEFNPPPTLNAYTPVTIRTTEKSSRFGEEGFANMAIGQINKVVSAVEVVPASVLRIVFADSSCIEVSLRDEDYEGPEAFTFFGKNNLIVAE